MRKTSLLDSCLLKAMVCVLMYVDIKCCTAALDVARAAAVAGTAALVIAPAAVVVLLSSPLLLLIQKRQSSHSHIGVSYGAVVWSGRLAPSLSLWLFGSVVVHRCHSLQSSGCFRSPSADTATLAASDTTYRPRNAGKRRITIDSRISQPS